MDFIMVIIICFGLDCQAIYEEFEYENYDKCISEAYGVSEYMKLTFPTSAGEVHCLDKQQFTDFEKYLQANGHAGRYKVAYKGMKDIATDLMLSVAHKINHFHRQFCFEVI